MDKKQRLLMEYIVRDIVEYIVSDTGEDSKIAMARFYESAVCDKLQDAGTGLYLCGSAAVYDLFQNELQHGRIIQQEI